MLESWDFDLSASEMGWPVFGWNKGKKRLIVDLNL